MTPVPELLHAIELVNDAITMVEIALTRNPSADDERALRQELVRLEAELAVLEAELDAALDDNNTAQGPSESQLAQMVAMVEEVERLAQRRATASEAIALASRALSLVVDVVTH